MQRYQKVPQRDEGGPSTSISGQAPTRQAMSRYKVGPDLNTRAVFCACASISFSCPCLQKDDLVPDASDIPWSSIFLAIGLTIFGIASLVAAWLHFTQRILGKEQAVRGWGLYR